MQPQIRQMIDDCKDEARISLLSSPSPESGKTSFAMSVLISYYKEIQKAGELVGSLLFSELPLYVNHEKPMIRDMVKWRLENNI